MAAEDESDVEKCYRPALDGVKMALTVVVEEWSNGVQVWSIAFLTSDSSSAAKFTSIIVKSAYFKPLEGIILTMHGHGAHHKISQKSEKKIFFKKFTKIRKMIVSN